MKNEILFTRMKKLVSTERRIGVKILECLYEIERRKAYAELRYDGLYTYCMKELGFTESQAYQRIQAMRALKELPELKPLIESGSLSVSSVSKVQTHLKRENKKGSEAVSAGVNEKSAELLTSLRFNPVVKFDRAEKLELFQSMENCTSREVDQKLAESRGEKLKEKLVLELDEEAAALWKQIQDLSAHKNQSEKTATFKMLMREWLKRNHPAREVRAEKSQKAQVQLKTEVLTQTVIAIKTATETEVEIETAPSHRRSVSTLTWRNSSVNSHRDPEARSPVTQSMAVKNQAAKSSQNSRSIPRLLRREVWRRDQGKCTKCGSKHALEIDHINPFALGGKTERENLRLLCRSCNRFAAIQIFGSEISRKIYDSRK